MPMPFGADALDAPPSPNPNGGVGGSAPFSIQSLGAGQQIPSNQLPPEMLTGITTSATKIVEVLDSFAQATPDKAAQIAMIKDLLQQYLADLMIAGSGPISPTASGSAFPGGGMDRGISGAGAV